MITTCDDCLCGKTWIYQEDESHLGNDSKLARMWGDKLSVKTVYCWFHVWWVFSSIVNARLLYCWIWHGYYRNLGRSAKQLGTCRRILHCLTGGCPENFGTLRTVHFTPDRRQTTVISQCDTLQDGMIRQRVASFICHFIDGTFKPLIREVHDVRSRLVRFVTHERFLTVCVCVSCWSRSMPRKSWSRFVALWNTTKWAGDACWAWQPSRWSLVTMLADMCKVFLYFLCFVSMFCYLSWRLKNVKLILVSRQSACSAGDLVINQMDTF